MKTIKLLGIAVLLTGSSSQKSIINAWTWPSLESSYQEASEKVAAANERQKASATETKTGATPASTKVPIVVSGDNKACFKSKGTTDQHAIVEVSVLSGEDAGKFQLIGNPFDNPTRELAREVLYPDTIKTYWIQDCADAIKRMQKPYEFSSYNKGNSPDTAATLFSVNAADPIKNSLTLTPGSTIEYFDCSKKYR